tara:strand:+ start:10470 stop:10619 length:150 start_codon:yes stop_codon:yes gene_type:complete
VEIKERQISEDNYLLIIAEIGINHQGSINNIAKNRNMVNEAYKSGAECI